MFGDYPIFARCSRDKGFVLGGRETRVQIVEAVVDGIIAVVKRENFERV
jgi:hypothetical protein